MRLSVPVPVPTKLADEEIPDDDTQPLSLAAEIAKHDKEVVSAPEVKAAVDWPIEDFNATEANELFSIDLSDVDPEVLEDTDFTPEELGDMGYVLPDAWQTATSEAPSMHHHCGWRWRLVEWIGRWKLVLGVFWSWVFWMWRVRRQALERQRREKEVRGLLNGHQYVGMDT